MKRIISTLTIFGCLAAAAADDLNCSITAGDGLVTYNIEGMTSAADAPCHFSWSNQTGNVIANHHEINREVVNQSSAGRLVTRTCFGLVQYEFNCGPKWEKSSGECHAVCPETVVVPAPPSSDYTTAAVVAAAITAFLVLSLAVIGWKNKSRLCKRLTRLPSRRQTGEAVLVAGEQDVPLNRQQV